MEEVVSDLGFLLTTRFTITAMDMVTTMDTILISEIHFTGVMIHSFMIAGSSRLL